MAHTHRELDRRSLVLHAKVAERLREQPSLLEVARANLERWLNLSEDGDLAAAALSEWQEILDSLSLEELLDLLVQEGERGDRLRQSSPFAGVLAPREVWATKRRFSGETTPA